MKFVPPGIDLHFTHLVGLFLNLMQIVSFAQHCEGFRRTPQARKNTLAHTRMHTNTPRAHVHQECPGCRTPCSLPYRSMPSPVCFVCFSCGVITSTPCARSVNIQTHTCTAIDDNDLSGTYASARNLLQQESCCHKHQPKCRFPVAHWPDLERALAVLRLLLSRSFKIRFSRDPITVQTASYTDLRL